MYEDMKKIILESPSGKGEDWISKRKGLEWSYEYKERPAQDKTLEKIGLRRIEDRDKFVKGFKEIAKSRAMINFMESCTHCGICLDKCHMFISTADVNNSPVGRAEISRKMYKKGNSLSASDVDLNKIYAYYYQCTECRRCSVFCPQGIDQSEITRNVREIMTEMGIMPDYLASTMAQVVKTGNNLGLTPSGIKSVVEFIEDEMNEETGKDIKIPVDKPKADILMIPSSADLYVNIDTLKGYAKVLDTLKKDWTISTHTTEAADFGLFASERYLKDFGDRVVEEALSRGSKLVIWGECGHGWRTANNYVRFKLAEYGIELIHIHQYTLNAMRRGDLRFDKNANDDLYTYHDPCNYARGGNLVNEPRELLKAVVRETVEAQYAKEKTFCCGAGAGLLADEATWNEFRAWAGWPALYYSWKTGAENMVSPCAIDKAQFPFLIDYHKVKMHNSGLMDLVGKALEI
ncbi:MAG: (Fe-S)-binding protein [Thermoplasma sp.]|nr:MAG: (Fe-S)-binding protein [Thermoplasma sp.]